MVLAILDDHPLIRQGVISVLQPILKDFEVIGFETVDAVTSHLNKNHIDYALVDLFLKNSSGFEFIRYIREHKLKTKIIVFTSSLDYRDYKQAMDLGVNGYVLKDSLPEDLVYAIKSVVRNRAYVDPFFMNADDSDDVNYENLTEREYEVFELIGRGYSNQEIADRLFISINTVKKHVTQVFSKLNTTERTQIAIMANDYFGRRGK